MCTSQRFAYRCNECLCNFVTDERLPGSVHPDKIVRGLVCGVCSFEGDKIVYMGQVRQQSNEVVEEVQRCLCDDRCVWAVGPVCNCMCGGRNHMTGAAGYTKTEVVLGKIKFNCLDDETIAKHQKIAKEFREAIETALTRKETFTPRAYWHGHKENEKFKKAINGSQHWRRMKYLQEVYTPTEVA